MTQQTKKMLLIWLCSLLISLVPSVEGSQICSLCGSPYLFPKRWDFPVVTNKTPWKTCRDVFFEAASVGINSGQCSTYQNNYKAVCCNDNIPPGWNVPPTPSPVINVGTGDEPDCDICGGNKYPGKPNVWIVARYVGEFACGTLYHRGKNGLIPGFMCGPLKDYVYDKCGCGQSNPAPVQAPQPKPTQPQASGCTVINGWVDQTGTPCSWYEKNDLQGCPEWGWYPGVGGATAKDACCHCNSCTDKSGWKDSSGTGCNWYENNEPTGCPNWWWYPGTNEKVAGDACCHCSTECQNARGWKDNAGTTCAWYEKNEPRGCPSWHWYPGSQGKNAGEACCHCKCQNKDGWKDNQNRGCNWYEKNDQAGCPSTGNNAGGGTKAKHACCHCRKS